MFTNIHVRWLDIPHDEQMLVFQTQGCWLVISFAYISFLLPNLWSITKNCIKSNYRNITEFEILNSYPIRVSILYIYKDQRTNFDNE